MLVAGAPKPDWAENERIQTALHCAVVSSSLPREKLDPAKDLVRILLAAKSDPNVRSKDGDTPLHYVAMYGKANGPDHVQQLLAAGADPSLKNNAGKTPLDIAMKDDKKALITALQAKP
jgi:ankyrin repeat protein